MRDRPLSHVRLRILFPWQSVVLISVVFLWYDMSAVRSRRNTTADHKDGVSYLAAGMSPGALCDRWVPCLLLGPAHPVQDPWRCVSFSSRAAPSSSQISAWNISESSAPPWLTCSFRQILGVPKQRKSYLSVTGAGMNGGLGNNLFVLLTAIGVADKMGRLPYVNMANQGTLHIMGTRIRELFPRLEQEFRIVYWNVGSFYWVG